MLAVAPYCMFSIVATVIIVQTRNEGNDVYYASDECARVTEALGQNEERAERFGS